MWLEKFKLPWRRGDLLAHFSPKNTHPLELFVRERENTNLAVGRDMSFHALDVDGRVFFAGAVPGIDGKLHHGEPVLEETLAKFRVGLPRLLRIDGQVEHRENPHTPIPA